MRRVIRLVIGVYMTIRAGIWGRIIISVVAVGTIACNHRVCAIQRVVLVVDGEGCRLPARKGRMAISAGIRQTE